MGYKSGEIYFIQEMPFRSESFPTFVKIGLVNESENRSSYDRLLEHQTANPRQLHLSDERIVRTHLLRKVESQMHGRYARKRVLNEWFEVESKDSLDSMIATATALATETNHRVLIEEQVNALNKLSDNGLATHPTQDAIQVATELCIEDKKISEIKRIEKVIEGRLRSAIDLGIDVRDAVTTTEVNKRIDLDKKSLESDHLDLYKNYLFDVEISARSFNYTKFRNSVSIEQAHDYEDFISSIKEIDNSVEQVADNEDAYSLNRPLLELTEIRVRSEWNQDGLKRQLQIQCGENLEIEGICRWSRRTVNKKRFDEKAFAESNKELFQQYLVESAPTKRIELTRWQIRSDVLSRVSELP